MFSKDCPFSQYGLDNGTRLSLWSHLRTYPTAKVYLNPQHAQKTLNTIVMEALYESFTLKESFDLVFERNENKIKYGKVVEDPQELLTAREDLLNKNSMSSVLSLNNDFPVINDERIELAFT